jgi:hypothetical protein
MPKPSLYATRRAQGLCGQCARRPLPGKSDCETCRGGKARYAASDKGRAKTRAAKTSPLQTSRWADELADYIERKEAQHPDWVPIWDDD